jgi:hypothetical protein
MTDAPNEEELEEIQHDIDDARHQAEAHGTIPSGPHRTFIDPDGDGVQDGDESTAPG